MVRRSRIPVVIVAVLVMSLPILVGLAIEGLGEGVVLLCFSILIAALAVLVALSGFSRRKWPTATATITESEIVAGRGLFGWRNSETDRLVVHYRYTVEEETFDRTEDVFADSEIVSKAFGGYPKKDGTVQVHYNPRKPAESVLAPGPGCLTLFFFVLGTAGTVYGCYLIWS